MARDQTRAGMALARRGWGNGDSSKTSATEPSRPSIMNFQVWMSAGSGRSQKRQDGGSHNHTSKRCGGASALALQDPPVCLWDGKRSPDTETGACPTQMDRYWGAGPQAPAVLLDPFVDLLSICRPGHRRAGGRHAASRRLVLPAHAAMPGIVIFNFQTRMAPKNVTIGGIGRSSLTLAWRDGKRDSRK